jgi:hypothetical protein
MGFAEGEFLDALVANQGRAIVRLTEGEPETEKRVRAGIALSPTDGR